MMLPLVELSNRQMLAFHNRANWNEVLVGWYATALPPGSKIKDGSGNEEEETVEYKCITDTSSLIHEVYAGECGGPSSLTVWCWIHRSDKTQLALSLIGALPLPSRGGRLPVCPTRFELGLGVLRARGFAWIR